MRSRYSQMFVIWWWYQEWPEEDYPPYANGPGYVLSSDIAHFIVSEFEKHKLRVTLSLSLSLLFSSCVHVFIVQVHCFNAVWHVFILLVIDIITTLCSCLKWKMWVWECGWNGSTAPNRLCISIAWSSASLGASKIIIQPITSLQGRWSACGTNCYCTENLSAATWDDDCDMVDLLQNLR